MSSLNFSNGHNIAFSLKTCNMHMNYTSMHYKSTLEFLVKWVKKTKKH